MSAQPVAVARTWTTTNTTSSFPRQRIIQFLHRHHCPNPGRGLDRNGNPFRHARGDKLTLASGSIPDLSARVNTALATPPGSPKRVADAEKCFNQFPDRTGGCI